ncbi:MAG: winged helix-turn-helix domain-containing protein [Planctomycetales bacterium]
MAAKKTTTKQAAAKVLAEAGEPLQAKTIVERAEAAGYWKSPGGKTPHATTYAAMIREINAKGKDARFAKTDRGMFTTANTK